MAEATAIKDRGAEWYYPAVKTAYGPKRLPHGERQETRYKAVKEAKRIIAAAIHDSAEGGEDE